MRRTFPPLLLLLLFAVTCPCEAAPVCSVSPDSLHFGTLVVGDFTETSFTVTNVGTDTLTGEFDSGCADFTLMDIDLSFSLAAGEADTFTVRFRPVASGSFSCTIPMITSNDGCDGPHCTGAGVLPASCVLEPPGLLFGDVAVGGTADFSFSIINEGGATLKGAVDAVCGPFDITDPVRSYALTPGGSRTFTVRFAPTGIGVYACTLSAGVACGGLPLGGNGIAPPPCSLTVEIPNGGGRPVEGDARTIRWRSMHCSDSVRIELLRADTVCAVIAEAAGNHGAFEWVVTPCGGGGDDYRVRITDLFDPSFFDESDGTFTILAAPVGEISVDSIDLQYDPLLSAGGTTSDTIFVTVGNGGGADLLVHAESESAWVVALPESITVAPGETDSFAVFADGVGLAGGLHTAVLRFVTNAPVDPVDSVAVVFSVVRYEPGDADGDGNVDLVDLVLLIDHILEIETLGEAVLRLGLADPNGDGAVNVADVVRLARAITEKTLKEESRDGGGEAGSVTAFLHERSDGPGLLLSIAERDRPRAAILLFRFDGEAPHAAVAGLQESGGAIVTATAGDRIALLFYDLRRDRPGGERATGGSAPIASLTSREESGLQFVRGSVVSTDGNVSTITGLARSPGPAGIADDDDDALLPAHPNPFRSETQVSYRLASPSEVRLSIFSVSGRLVRILDSGVRSTGTTRVEWDGRDNRGRAVAPGIYLLRLDTARDTHSRRMAVMR